MLRLKEKLESSVQRSISVNTMIKFLHGIKRKGERKGVCSGVNSTRRQQPACSSSVAVLRAVSSRDTPLLAWPSSSRSWQASRSRGRLILVALSPDAGALSLFSPFPPPATSASPAKFVVTSSPLSNSSCNPERTVLENRLSPVLPSLVAGVVLGARCSPRPSAMSCSPWPAPSGVSLAPSLVASL